MLQRQNYNVAPTLPQRSIVCSTHNILWMLYWQHCCNTETTRSNSQCLGKVDTLTSNLQRCGNVASTNGNIDTTLKPQRQIHNVFSTLILRRCARCCFSFVKKVKCTLFRNQDPGPRTLKPGPRTKVLRPVTQDPGLRNSVTKILDFCLYRIFKLSYSSCLMSKNLISSDVLQCTFSFLNYLIQH